MTEVRFYFYVSYLVSTCRLALTMKGIVAAERKEKCCEGGHEAEAEIEMPGRKKKKDRRKRERERREEYRGNVNEPEIGDRKRLFKVKEAKDFFNEIRMNKVTGGKGCKIERKEKKESRN